LASCCGGRDRASSDDGLLRPAGRADRHPLQERAQGREGSPDAPGRCDVQLLLTAARSFYETLLRYGVEIYERQHVILHAKTMCIDREYTVIGSTNLDYRSIEYNLELSVLIKSKEFGEQMHDLFENDVRYAQRITSRYGEGVLNSTDFINGGQPRTVSVVAAVNGAGTRNARWCAMWNR